MNDNHLIVIQIHSIRHLIDFLQFEGQECCCKNFVRFALSRERDIGFNN
jgi:hypothetical protein